MSFVPTSGRNPMHEPVPTKAASQCISDGKDGEHSFQGDDGMLCVRCGKSRLYIAAEERGGRIVHVFGRDMSSVHVDTLNVPKVSEWLEGVK